MNDVRGLAAIIASAAALAFAPGAGFAQALVPTLATHTGPWYEPGAPETENLWRPDLGGRRLLLKGRVRATNAAPVDGALVEFWHTDGHGNYPPLRASRRTAPDGGFRIATVLPGHNGGYRARHIHFLISHAEHRQLVTRIFFKGDVNMGEAPFPELAVFLEEGLVRDETVFFGDVEFVVEPR